MGIEDGKPSRLHIKPRPTAETPATGIKDSDPRLHIKPRTIREESPPSEVESRLHIKARAREGGEAPKDRFAVGNAFINRDMERNNPDDPTISEFRVASAEGEPGKRHIVLKNLKGTGNVGKGEKGLETAIAEGIWRPKE